MSMAISCSSPDMVALFGWVVVCVFCEEDKGEKKVCGLSAWPH